MSSKEHVRELRSVLKVKTGHSHKFDKFDKKTCKSVFFKELVFVFDITILSKTRMDVHSTPLLFN